MNIVKVLTPSANLIAEYPDMIAMLHKDWIYIWDPKIDQEDRDYGSAGNWKAVFRGPVIIWEENQA